jgi:hypothetical protein
MSATTFDASHGGFATAHGSEGGEYAAAVGGEHRRCYPEAVGPKKVRLTRFHWAPVAGTRCQPGGDIGVWG